MSIKKIIGTIHLWLGLASGIVVFVISLTGCIYVFSNEIFHFIHKEVLYVAPQNKAKLPIGMLWDQAQKHAGDAYTLQRVTAYQQKNRSYVFYSYQRNPSAITYFGTIDHYIAQYVNPYTGETLGTINKEFEFFNLVKMLHWSLLLNTQYGQPIVGWSTFIFVIMLVSGLYLWWPRNKSARKQRFAIKWRARWRRINYDLHQVLGFYIIAIVLIIACTGMVWAFTWFKAAVYTIASGTTAPPQALKATSTPTDFVPKDKPIDRVHRQVQKTYPNAYAIYLSRPQDSTQTISAYVQELPGLYYKNASLQFDQYTGQLLTEKHHKDKNFGEKIIAANYDIHVGAILGIPGKIIAFFASLISASLPITGFTIWLGRKKNQHKRRCASQLKKKTKPPFNRPRQITEVAETSLH